MKVLQPTPLTIRQLLSLMIIHRYWTGPNEPRVDGPVWHDSDLPKEIKKWCDSRSSQTKAIDYPRHRANMVRWWLLAKHGGLWLDHDATLHGPVPKPCFVGFRGQATSAVIHLTANHQLAWAMLDHIEKQPSSDKGCPNVSGDNVLDSLLMKNHSVFKVRLEPIPSPNASPTWIHHALVTSTERVKLRKQSI